MNLGLKQRVWQVPQVQQAVVLRLKTGKLRRLNEMIGVRKNIVLKFFCVYTISKLTMHVKWLIFNLPAGKRDEKKTADKKDNKKDEKKDDKTPTKKEEKKEPVKKDAHTVRKTTPKKTDGRNLILIFTIKR